MSTENKKILIVDECRFSRICSALLQMLGYGTHTVNGINDLPSALSSRDIGLIVTSYPYGAFLFEEIKKSGIPIIVLSDNIDGKLIRLLNNFNQSYCMVKPVDYDKFRTLVKDVITGAPTMHGGYSIL